MRVLQTKDAILKALPEIPQEYEHRINASFIPYLFYENNKKEGYRECWCTSCREHFFYDFTQRTETPEHYEFLGKKHNDWTVCPKCGRDVRAKEIGRAKSCRNLDEWRRFVCVLPKGKNAVFLACLYATKNYSGIQYGVRSGKDYLVEPEYNIAAMYYLTPHNARMFKKAWDYTYLGLRDCKFHETKSIHEPFTKTYCYNWSSWDKRGYEWIGMERLQGTFLEYAPLDLFREAHEELQHRSWRYDLKSGVYECPEVKFLAYCAKYPSIERLLKIDMSDFAMSLLCGKPMKRYIDWDAKTPKEMFRMNKAEFAEFRTHYYSMDDFRVFQNLKEAIPGVRYDVAGSLCREHGPEAAERLANAVKRHGLSLTRVQNYLKKHTRKSQVGTKAILWTDYLHFAERLKYDLSRDDVVFPKRLTEAHDNASAAVSKLTDAENFKKYEKRYTALRKKYEFSDGIFEIVIPTGINDIVAEGKALSHCVGGYASRHVEGKTTILFLREVSSPTHRLVTIAVNEGQKRIAQAHGKRNRALTKEEKAFVDKWFDWVLAGSKRPKAKKGENKTAANEAT